MTKIMYLTHLQYLGFRLRRGEHWNKIKEKTCNFFLKKKPSLQLNLTSDLLTKFTLFLATNQM